MGEYKKKMHNSSFIIKDLIQGDEELSKREEFLNLDNREIRDALRIIMGNPHLSEKEKIHMVSNSWRIHYRVKPISIEEFLTSEWIGPTADSLFPMYKRF